MSRPLRLRLRQGIAMVTLDAGPANRIDDLLCAALWDVFGHLSRDPGLRAVLLVAEGRHFSAGRDLRRIGAPEAPPGFDALCARIEGFARPVVAVLQGPALGAGAALALAAHARIAAPGAAIGFPDVALGLLPEPGATQRLPRLTGAAAGLAMLLGGKVMPAQPAAAIGLFDAAVAGDDPAGAALAQLEDWLAAGLAPRPTLGRRDRMTDGAAWMAAIAEQRAAQRAAPGAHFAAARIVDCVEAALLLPPAAALAIAQEAQAACLSHPQSRALRHLHLAERRIAPELLSPLQAGQRVPGPQGRVVVERLLMAAHRAKGEGDPDRALAAWLAEGARMVEEGLVRQPADIDVLAVHGAGFDRLRGGPMHAAQQAGLLRLRNLMRVWAQDDPVWTPPALLSEAVKWAAGFDALPFAAPPAVVSPA